MKTATITFLAFSFPMMTGVWAGTDPMPFDIMSVDPNGCQHFRNGATVCHGTAAPVPQICVNDWERDDCLRQDRDATQRENDILPCWIDHRSCSISWNAVDAKIKFCRVVAQDTFKCSEIHRPQAQTDDLKADASIPTAYSAAFKLCRDEGGSVVVGGNGVYECEKSKLAADCKAADDALDRALAAFEHEVPSVYKNPEDSRQERWFYPARESLRYALTARLKLNCGAVPEK